MHPQPNSPTTLRQSIWHHLTRAPHDRHHPWRTPALTSTTPDGEPNARTVALRAANATQQTPTAFTDHRSAKAFELAQQPKALLVFWSDRLKWQLRVRALVTVQTIGPESWEWLTPSKGATATRAQSHAELFAPRTPQIGSRTESFGALSDLSARRLS